MLRLQVSGTLAMASSGLIAQMEIHSDCIDNSGMRYSTKKSQKSAERIMIPKKITSPLSVDPVFDGATMKQTCSVILHLKLLKAATIYQK